LNNELKESVSYKFSASLLTDRTTERLKLLIHLDESLEVEALEMRAKLSSASYLYDRIKHILAQS
jgi:hypothetical protein